MKLLNGLFIIAVLIQADISLGASCTASAEAVISPLEFEIDNCKVVAEKDSFIVDLAKLKTGDDTRDKHMREKYLETSKYPVAKFQFSARTKDTFTGMLSLHGKKKLIRGKRDGNTYKFKVDVTKFGIAIPEYGSINIAKHISITVKL